MSSIIAPRGELKLTLTFESRSVVVRGQMDGKRTGIAALLAMLPALYKELLQCLERMQDKEETAAG
jgi:hypothetical protein